MHSERLQVGASNRQDRFFLLRVEAQEMCWLSRFAHSFKHEDLEVSTTLWSSTDDVPCAFNALRGSTSKSAAARTKI